MDGRGEVGKAGDEAYYLGRSPWLPGINCKLGAYVAQGQRISFGRHDKIIEAGEPVGQFYYLAKGTARAVVLNHDGSEKLLFVLTAPSILAETAVLTGGTSLVNFIAETDCEVVRFSESAMEQLLERDSELVRQMLRCMAQKTKSLVHQLAGTAMNGAEERLLRLLYILYWEWGYEEDGRRVIPRRLTHADLANAAGLHRVTVSNLLSGYQKNNIMHKEKERIVIDNWAYVVERVL